MKLKKSPKAIWALVISVVLILAAVLGVIMLNTGESVSKVLSIAECQKIVDNDFSTLPKSTAIVSKKLFKNSKITVKSVKEGNLKNLILNCEYETSNIASIIIENKDELMREVYLKYLENEKNGISTNATRISIDMSTVFNTYYDNAETIKGVVELQLFEIEDGKFKLYLQDEAINTCTGNLLNAITEINGITEVTVKGESIDISKKNTLRRGIEQCIQLTNYDNTMPDVGSPLVKWWNSFCDEFKRNFIDKSQWKYLTDGLLTTISITGLAALIGMFIGFIVAIVRCTYQTTGKLKILDKIFGLYLTVMRGTPVMVQLLIIYFVILLPLGVDKFPAAVLCFGLNSGAYVAEIVRGGIMSIDKGQIEAGRSLGFNYPVTMYHIVIPQAFKAVLPALANEFITLLKESSVAFYIGVADLTQGGLKIRSITYSNFMPLIAVALIYLVIVIILTKLVGILERRLRKSDH